MPIAWCTERAPLEELLLQVDINHEESADAIVILKDVSGALYISAEDLSRLHLRTPSAAAIVSNGAIYYPLAALSPLTIKLDAAAQRLLMELPVTSFATTEITPYGTGLQPI